MTFHSPWDQPAYKKATKRKAKKATKRKAKKTTKRKAKKTTKRKAKKAKKRGRRGGVPSVRIVVSGVELNKIRKNVARPQWVDQLPKSKRKVFNYKGKSYWPLFSLLYMIDAVEVVPLSQWDGPTNTKEYGSLLHPGFVDKIGGKNYVYVQQAQFIQRGSPLDV